MSSRGEDETLERLYKVSVIDGCKQGDEFEREYKEDPVGIEESVNNSWDETIRNVHGEVLDQIEEEGMAQRVDRGIGLPRMQEVRRAHRNLIEQNAVENENHHLYRMYSQMSLGGKMQILPQEQEKINKRLYYIEEKCPDVITNLKEALQIGGNDLSVGDQLNIIVKVKVLTIIEQEERRIPREVISRLEKNNKKPIELTLNEQRVDLLKLLGRQMPELVSLDLTNCNLTDEDIVVLVDRCGRIPNVVRLQLNSNRFRTLTGQHLKRMKQKMRFLTVMEVCDLSVNKQKHMSSVGRMLSPESTKDVLEFMYWQRVARQQYAMDVVLSSIDLSSMRFQITKLSEINLSAYRRVICLDLSNNQFKDEGFEVISNIIGCFKQLSQLNLSRNKITKIKKATLQRINKLVNGRQQMLYINLFDNHLDSSTLRTICEVYNDNDMTPVCIESNQISIDRPMQRRARMEMRQEMGLLVGMVESNMNERYQWAFVERIMNKMEGLMMEGLLGCDEIKKIVGDVMTAGESDKLMGKYRYMIGRMAELYGTLGDIDRDGVQYKRQEKRVVELIMKGLNIRGFDDGQSGQSTVSSSHVDVLAEDISQYTRKWREGTNIVKRWFTKRVDVELLLYRVIERVYHDFHIMCKEQNSQIWGKIKAKYSPWLDRISGNGQMDDVIEKLDAYVVRVNNDILQGISIGCDSQSGVVKFSERSQLSGMGQQHSDRQSFDTVNQLDQSQLPHSNEQITTLANSSQNQPSILQSQMLTPPSQ